MDRRWEQRRAAASARWAELTASHVLERADVSGVQPTGLADAPIPASAELLLEDMRRLELKDQSYAIAPHAAGPTWLRDTQRALLLVAAISCSLLLALLYFGGFVG
jgi:hypothetical protein